MNRIGSFALVVFLLTASTAATQSPPVSPSGPRAVLRGVILEAGTGAALVRARVDVTSAAVLVGTVITDERGEFSVPVPISGTLAVRIVKAGYGALKQTVRPEHLKGVEPLVVRVARSAAINGRVVTTTGERPWASLVMLRPLSDAGIPIREDVQTAEADERGEFRFGGLPAGRYNIESSTNLAASGPVRGAVVDLTPGADVNVDVVFIPGNDFIPPLPAPDGDGSTIRGTVSTADGAPLAGVRVIAGQKGGAGSATTDITGRFAIAGLSPGPVTVTASKAGYVGSNYGQQAGPRQVPTATVYAGRDVDNVSLVLLRSSVVTGTVVDEHGEPLQDAGVQLLRVRRSAAGLVAMREQYGPTPRTDDRGQFKVSIVTPGDYILAATLPPEAFDPVAGPRMAYVPAYYPDTHDVARAAPIRIGREEEIAGILLTMRRVPVLRVTGSVANSEGSSFTGTVRLVPRSIGLTVPEARAIRPDANGEFVFADVTAGDYVIQAFASSVSPGPQFASTPITLVDRDPEPVRLRTAPGSSLSGRFVLEGAGAESLWGYSVSAVGLDVSVSTPATSSHGGPVADGEPFALSGLSGSTRLRVWSDDASWYLKSVLINGFEAADAPFDFGSDGRAYTDVDVVFSRGGATVAGRATDDRAAPVREYAVYVFATDRDKWIRGSRWVRLARADADGSFKVVSLPPGEYWVAAVDHANAARAETDWVDLELFEMLALRATRVTLGERQSSDITLRVIQR
jgi:hypothetical protein